ncbi:MAG: thioredoxin family protein [Sphingopyxis sp.]
MNRKFFAALITSLLLMTPALAADGTTPRTLPGVEDAYKSDVFNADPMPAVDTALAAAKQSGKRVLLVMGTGGCHDSAWFANLLATDRFAPVRDRYEIVYADIGMPHVRGWGRNPAVPKRFKFKIKGTPTIAVLDADGNVLNRKAAASRSDDDIYNELMQ